MTYDELLQTLQHMKRTQPEKLKDQVAFVPEWGDVKHISHAEWNDGSISLAEPYQLLLMEV